MSGLDVGKCATVRTEGFQSGNVWQSAQMQLSLTYSNIVAEAETYLWKTIAVTVLLINEDGACPKVRLVQVPEQAFQEVMEELYPDWKILWIYPADPQAAPEVE